MKKYDERRNQFDFHQILKPIKLLHYFFRLIHRFHPITFTKVQKRIKIQTGSIAIHSTS